jgi:hypothetical protein
VTVSVHDFAPSRTLLRAPVVIEERVRPEAFEGNCRAFALWTGAHPYAIFNRKNSLASTAKCAHSVDQIFVDGQSPC